MEGNVKHTNRGNAQATVLHSPCVDTAVCIKGCLMVMATQLTHFTTSQYMYSNIHSMGL